MRKITFFVISMCFSALLLGQDVHLAQFYNSPLTLNPAMTGLMNNDIRLIANYRNQWSSVTTPFQTFAASVDASIMEGAMEDDFFGVGLQLMTDKAGDSEFRTTQAQFSAAYSKSLTGNSDNYISFGGQIGLVSRSISYNNLTFDNQYDGDILNPDISSGENFSRFKYSYVDFSAGLAWYVAPTNYSSIYMGLALAHLNEPNQSFYEDEIENLYRKFTAHFGAEVGGSGSVSFMPSAVLLLQGPHREINIGGSVRFDLTKGLGVDEGGMAMHIGTMHRVGDAQIIMGRFDYGKIGFALSYDINFSTLRQASNTRGGPELSIVYKTNFFQDDKRSQSGGVRCPAF